MSLLKSIKEIYSNVPKQEKQEFKVSPVNQDLMSKVTENLSKSPIIAPKVK